MRRSTTRTMRSSPSRTSTRRRRSIFSSSPNAISLRSPRWSRGTSRFSAAASSLHARSVRTGDWPSADIGSGSTVGPKAARSCITSTSTFWRAAESAAPSARRAKQRLQGGEPPGALALLRQELLQTLLHQVDSLDGLRLGNVHLAGLASGLCLADQLGRVRAARLGTGGRAGRLDILRAAARCLDILGASARPLHVLGAAPRGLDILRAAARSLDVLGAAARGLDILRAAPRRLHVLGAATRRLDILRAAARRLHVLGAAAGRLDILRATRDA